MRATITLFEIINPPLVNKLELLGMAKSIIKSMLVGPVVAAGSFVLFLHPAQFITAKLAALIPILSKNFFLFILKNNSVFGYGKKLSH